ncbi:recombinase family protein [uncultured Veillonella sp.]|uniref:recombinase family protein n=1 Tax=uncultured Veillonella sp. TaxID=159268 RepID=UPI002597E943|nr:recombinase family protein [uncultured Veillonella sp.]
MSNYKVGIYIRVSTQEQANEGYSIDAQKDRLSCYCKSRDWDIYNIYIDGGFSGSNINRPALTQLLSDIKEDKLNCVIVYKLDRLSRSQKDTLYIIEDVILKHNVDFVSLNENFDTSSPFGRAMIGILSVFAQLEREQIKERSMMGRIERAKNGLWHGGGYDPFGYKYIDGKLVVDEYEATIVKDVFAMFNRKIPIHRIHTILTEKYGKSIHETVIRSILTTRLYTGKISYLGNIYDGLHDAIISTADFETAQNLLEIRKTIYNNKPFVSKTLLGGLLYCSHCGARYLSKGNYSGRGANRYYRAYYTCYSRAKSNKKYIIDPNCKNPSYPVTELDRIILNEIYVLVTNAKAFDAAISKSTPDKLRTKQKDAITHKLENLDKQLSKLLDLYQLDSIPLDKLQERIIKLQTKKDTLQKELMNLPVKRKKLSPKDVMSMKESIINVLNNDDSNAHKKLVHTLIDKIYINDTKNSFEILWNF